MPDVLQFASFNNGHRRLLPQPSQQAVALGRRDRAAPICADVAFIATAAIGQAQAFVFADKSIKPCVLLCGIPRGAKSQLQDKAQLLKLAGVVFLAMAAVPVRQAALAE